MNTRLPKERERKIQSSIRIRLGYLGINLYRRNVALVRTGDGRRFSVEAPGRADLYGWEIKTGRHWEIETKRPGNKPTPLQLGWLKEATRLGAVAYWCDNTNDCERVAEAILRGGRIMWGDGDDYWIEMT